MSPKLTSLKKLLHMIRINITKNEYKFAVGRLTFFPGMATTEAIFV